MVNSKAMLSLSLDLEQIKQLKMQAVCDRSYWNRVSIALAVRLLDRSDPYFDQFAVLDELDYLEGISPCTQTKEEQQFKKKPLHPLWHKHFFMPKHLLRNVGLRWNLCDNGNKDLTKLIERIAAEDGDNPDVWPGRLVDHLVVKGFNERAQRGLTGDWIVYAKHEGKNYYLDLASHEEGLELNAEALLQKLRNGSQVDFPFAFDAQTPTTP